MYLNIASFILAICSIASAYSGCKWQAESKKDTTNFYIGLIQQFLAGVLLSIAIFYY